MDILNTLIHKDQELLVFLNSLGSQQWDTFWLLVTNKFVWLPLYLFILFFLINKMGWKKGLFVLLLVAIMVAFTDQIVNLIKNTTQRLRPINTAHLESVLRIIKRTDDFSFVSGHATNSFAVSSFVIATLQKVFRPIYFVLLWPFLFAYSRVYLGLHYPSDVVGGMLLGVLIGYFFYQISKVVFKKYENRF